MKEKHFIHHEDTKDTKKNIYSTRVWITAFVPLSLRERVGVRGI